MNLCRALFFLAIVLTLSADSFAQSGEFIPGRRGWHLVNGVWVRPSASCGWSDLITFTWRDGNLSPRVCPTETGRSVLSAGRRALIEIGAMQDLYVATTRSKRWASLPAAERQKRPLLPYSTLSAEFVPSAHAPRSTGLQITRVQVEAGDVRVAGRGSVNGTLVDVEFRKDETGGVTLTVTDLADAQAAGIDFSERADRAADLLLLHQRVTRTYLSPLLRPLAGGADPFAAGAADVYAAFDQVEPSSEAVRMLNGILARMNAPDPRERDRAMESLRATPDTVVCAALRLTRDDLTPQQAMMIDASLRERSRRFTLANERADPTALRRDPLFLIDCLEFDDARVRAEAIRTLSEVMIRSFDVDPRSKERCVALAIKLRAEWLSR